MRDFAHRSQHSVEIPLRPPGLGVVFTQDPAAAESALAQLAGDVNQVDATLEHARGLMAHARERVDVWPHCSRVLARASLDQ